MKLSTSFFTVLSIATIFSCSKDKVDAKNLAQDKNKETNEVPTTTSDNSQQEANIALNPEHGKPGHRCEIPVGAPLNSAPSVTQSKAPVSNSIFDTNPLASSKNTNPTTTPISTPANSANIQPVATKTAGKTVTAPGMNPPHGEPGHKCEIPVGAPLNSKPAETPKPVAQPSQPVNPPTKTITAPGMNPPHGEPGHKCEIPVGSPLN